jgi:hypothetical protein
MPMGYISYLQSHIQNTYAASIKRRKIKQVYKKYNIKALGLDESYLSHILELKPPSETP